jgi:hypothetical protein
MELTKTAVMGVVLAVALAIPAKAWAASYPPDPISPTDASECHQLYDRYRALHQQLAGEAKSVGGEAWAVVRARNGPSIEASRLYQRSSQLHDQAFDVLTEASRARTRCMAAVNAYRRNRNVLAETQRSLDDLPERAGRSMRDGMLSGGIKLLEKFGSRSSFGGVSRRAPIGTGGGLVIGGLRSALEAYGGLDGLLGRSGSSGSGLGLGGSVGLLGYSQAAGWNVVQRRLVKTALETLLDMHQSAVTDLHRATAQFHGASGDSLQSRLTAMSRKTSVEIMGGYRGGGASRVAPEGGDLSAEYVQAQDQVRKAMAARSESSSRAMAAAAAERERTAAAAAQRRAAQQRVDRGPSKSSTGGSRGSGKADAATCSQIANSIARQREIVADYEGPRYSYGPQGRQWARDVERPRLRELQAQYSALC